MSGGPFASPLRATRRPVNARHWHPGSLTRTRRLPRAIVALDTPPAFASALGIPVRITRPRRYSLYRASDGLSYLGERDWNPGALRFNTIQPVSGPFAPAAEHGLVFRYLDSTGASLVIPVANPARDRARASRTSKSRRGTPCARPAMARYSASMPIRRASWCSCTTGAEPTWQALGGVRSRTGGESPCWRPWHSWR